MALRTPAEIKTSATQLLTRDAAPGTITEEAVRDLLIDMLDSLEPRGVVATTLVDEIVNNPIKARAVLDALYNALPTGPAGLNTGDYYKGNGAIIRVEA